MEGLKGPGEARSYDGSQLRIGIVHARWNTRIVSALVEGARQSLAAAGVRDENVVVQSVPGSYELPFAVQRMYASSQIQSSASSTGGALISAATDLLSASTTDLTAIAATAFKEPKDQQQQKHQPSATSTSTTALTTPFDAIIAIGVLIKGETMHFEFIADAVSHGLMRVQLDSQVPVVFGLLTVMNENQGLARAGLEGSKMHNHGEDWGRAAVELGVKRKGWAEGKMDD